VRQRAEVGRAGREASEEWTILRRKLAMFMTTTTSVPIVATHPEIKIIQPQG